VSEVKLSLSYHEGAWRNGGRAPHRRHQIEPGQLHNPVPLLLGKETIGAIDEETEWVADPTGTLESNHNPASSPVAISNKLSLYTIYVYIFVLNYGI
jgi:hypothetical protein